MREVLPGDAPSELETCKVPTVPGQVKQGHIYLKDGGGEPIVTCIVGVHAAC